MRCEKMTVWGWCSHEATVILQRRLRHIPDARTARGWAELGWHHYCKFHADGMPPEVWKEVK